jgi:hypothetical protein
MKSTNNLQTADVVLVAVNKAGILKANDETATNKAIDSLERYGFLNEILRNPEPDNCQEIETIQRNYKSVLAFRLSVHTHREFGLTAEIVFKYAVETGLIDDEDISGSADIAKYHERLTLISNYLSSSTFKVNLLRIFDDYMSFLHFKLYLRQLISINNACS